MLHLTPWILWPATFLGIIFVLVYIYVTWNYNYWKNLGVPTLKARFPFGNLFEVFMVRRAPQDFYRDLYDSFKGQRYAGFMAVDELVLLPRDPELIKSILVKEFSHFQDRGFASDEDYDSMSTNLFNLKGRRWTVLRHKLSPTFTSGKMKILFPLVKKCCEELRETIERDVMVNGNEMEFKDLLARYTTDAIASVAFGVEGGSLANPNAEFRTYGRRVFDSSLVNSLRTTARLVAPYLSARLGIKNFDAPAVEYFINAANAMVERREKSGEKRPDFLQLLIGLKENDNVSLTKAEIEAQCFAFFAAGFETSSTAVSFCIHELAQNLDIQDELRSEVEKVLSLHNGEITYQSLAEMPFMDKVLNETMRKYPAVPILFRECNKQFLIPPASALNENQWNAETRSGGLTIEVGTKIHIPVAGLHYDSQYFPDPERFDPSRFNEEAIKARPSYVFMPFGEGPRICIGMRFGIMQAAAALAVLVSNFEFRPSSKTTHPLALEKRAFFPATRDGVWIKVIKRS